MDACDAVGIVIDPRVRLQQLTRVEPVRLVNGRSDGVRAFEVDTAAGLQLTCIADRALDVARLKWKGISLCWESSNGIAAPSYYDPHGNGFLKSFFGGMLTTCGLTNFGPGGKDRWGEFGLHGRVDHLPAQDVAVTRPPDARAVCISGTIRETRVFGCDFRLERRWKISTIDSRIELDDRVTNEGGKSWPHMILYHCNAGFPLLDRQTQVALSHASMRPRDAAAKAGQAEWNRGADPQANFAEEVFIHTMRTGGNEKAVGIVANRELAGGLGLRISFDPRQLPNAFTWRMLGIEPYVFAIEPANCDAIEGRISAAQRGVLPMVEPGETREYNLAFDVLAGDDLDAAMEGLERSV
ncbi:MAG: aldose 1-epimerase family protein [Candidatus Baltobacteraceae bacterium]